MNSNLQSETGIALVFCLMILMAFSLVTSVLLIQTNILNVTAHSFYKNIHSLLEVEQALPSHHHFKIIKQTVLKDTLNADCENKIQISTVQAGEPIRYEMNILTKSTTALFKADSPHFFMLEQPAPKESTFQDFHFLKNFNVQLQSQPKIIPSHDASGNILYFVGQTQNKKGVYLFKEEQDPVYKDGLKLLAEGEFLDVLVWFENLVAVPIKTGELPKVFDILTETEKKILWTCSLESNANPNMPLSPHVNVNLIPNSNTKAKLYWDPKQNKEILLTLNLKNQLTICSASLSGDKIHKPEIVSWRKLNNTE